MGPTGDVLEPLGPRTLSEAEEAFHEQAEALRDGGADLAWIETMFADNELMLKLLRDLGQVRVVHSEQGTVELRVDLPETGLGHVRRLLGAIARGEIIPFGRGAGHSIDSVG